MRKVERIPNEKALSNNAICGNCKSDLIFNDGVQETNDRRLVKLISNTKTPLIVDFCAECCGPCKAFAPTFKSAAKEILGKVSFVKINKNLIIFMLSSTLR